MLLVVALKADYISLFCLWQRNFKRAPWKRFRSEVSRVALGGSNSDSRCAPGLEGRNRPSSAFSSSSNDSTFFGSEEDSVERHVQYWRRRRRSPLLDDRMSSDRIASRGIITRYCRFLPVKRAGFEISKRGAPPLAFTLPHNVRALISCESQRP